ncbi:MAG: MiaB/RimO family radical SAM methylthiotransferase, partial [Bdellovibrionales bacterium]|nr:MiaB/RimO family radical SAM methylthiotransferase [Bdellovibrionales bacterium]
MDSLVNQNPTFSIETFGCKVNSYDTGLLQKRLQSRGWSWSKTEPNIHVLNTCAVTGEATKEALRRIRKIKARHPEALVVVTGCAAQVDTDQLSNLSAADLIIANSHKGRLEEIVDRYYKGDRQRVFKSNIFKKEELEAGGGVRLHHTRSFLKIQDGCDSFCTYCVIPFARGKSRSLSIKNLVQRVQALYQQGVREVVLTGVHIGDYEDVNLKLEDLIETLLKKTFMPRFRLSSLEPVELSDRLLELYQDPRMCPHFHMSIQSAQTKVLKDIKRNYGAQEVEESLEKIALRLPRAFVGMDVIVGFPGESEAEFQETHDRLASLPWTRIHV